jgi:GH18 family chitinase
MNKLQLLKDYRASGGKGNYVSLMKEVRNSLDKSYREETNKQDNK